MQSTPHNFFTGDFKTKRAWRRDFNPHPTRQMTCSVPLRNPFENMRRGQHLWKKPMGLIIVFIVLLGYYYYCLVMDATLTKLPITRNVRSLYFKRVCHVQSLNGINVANSSAEHGLPLLGNSVFAHALPR